MTDAPAPLHRIIYRSQCAIPGAPTEVDEEVATIVAASRGRNAAAGVTGVLLHSDATFTQVLEGTLPALEAVYDRITADLRHTSFELLQFGPIGERDFTGWGMVLIGRVPTDRTWRETGGPTGITPSLAAAAAARVANLLGRRILPREL